MTFILTVKKKHHYNNIHTPLEQYGPKNPGKQLHVPETHSPLP